MGKKVKVIEGGICAPKGFKAGAIACGIKNPAVERLDLALIYSEFPTVGAAVYTQNQVCAAPVRLSSSHLKSAEPRAIIANSGNANACTGPDGLLNARAMTAATAKALGLRQREVQVCSTGIIESLSRSSGSNPASPSWPHRWDAMAKPRRAPS